MGSETVALVNGRTAGKQGVSWRGAAIHLQWAEKRVGRVGDGAELIRIYSVGKTGTAVNCAEQVETLGSKQAKEIQARAITSGISHSNLSVLRVCPAVTAYICEVKRNQSVPDCGIGGLIPNAATTSTRTAGCSVSRAGKKKWTGTVATIAASAGYIQGYGARGKGQRTGT